MWMLLYLLIKKFLREIIEKFSLATVLTPSQSIILKDIKPQDKQAIEDLMKQYNILPIEQVDPLTRLSMACPALPLCGLAVTEAERRMPEWNSKTNKLLEKVGLKDETLITRMTGFV